MNNLLHRSRSAREGYVTLLAMSFAFGLAVFGGALAAGLHAYLKTAATEQRDVLDRIVLESAAADVLGRLAAGQSHPVRPSILPGFELNQRRVVVGLALPEGKLDLAMDDDRKLTQALRRHGVAVSPAGGAPPSSFRSLEALSRAWRLSAADEDCLRRIVTVGRAPEDFRREAAAGDGPSLSRSAAVGDQVDIRSAIDHPSGVNVLWIRARLTGSSGPGVELHDYRRLSIASSPLC